MSFGVLPDNYSDSDKDIELLPMINKKPGSEGSFSQLGSDRAFIRHRLSGCADKSTAGLYETTTTTTMAEFISGEPAQKKVKREEFGSGEPPPKKLKCEDIPVLPSEKRMFLKDALHHLETDILFSLNLLKIKNSNADMCVPFKDSFLKVERCVEQRNPCEATKVFNFAGVFVKGVKILRSYLDDPEKVPVDKESKIALQRLIQTILKIEDIRQSLAKVKRMSDKKRETAWTICMVHHLLKELSVGNQYKIDINSKFKSITCICCNEPIQDFGRYDDCSLGNRAVWHGNVDILLGPHPIAVYAHDSEDRDIDGSLSSFEVEDSEDLMIDRSQILAETIVFAFLQKKNNPAFDNYLIPTVAISKKDVLFHFYDPEHDVLLESPLFNIHAYDNKLYYPTILALWFTLNYKTFCTGITRGMKERNFTADFLSKVSTEVKTIYQEDLQFGECGVGLFKLSPFMPKPCSGLVLDMSEPYNSSALK